MPIIIKNRDFSQIYDAQNRDFPKNMVATTAPVKRSR